MIGEGSIRRKGSTDGHRNRRPCDYRRGWYHGRTDPTPEQLMDDGRADGIKAITETERVMRLEEKAARVDLYLASAQDLGNQLNKIRVKYAMALVLLHEHSGGTIENWEVIVGARLLDKSNRSH